MNFSILHIKCFLLEKKKSLNCVPIKTKKSLILTVHTFAHFKVPPSLSVSVQPSFRILFFKMLMTSSPRRWLFLSKFVNQHYICIDTVLNTVHLHGKYKLYLSVSLESIQQSVPVFFMSWGKNKKEICEYSSKCKSEFQITLTYETFVFAFLEPQSTQANTQEIVSIKIYTKPGLT